jgi:hypothetical protein
MAITTLAQTQKHSTKAKVSSPTKKTSKTVTPPLVKQDSIVKIKQDMINANYKGPYGETVYNSQDGRLYYIDKNDLKVYITLEK